MKFLDVGRTAAGNVQAFETLYRQFINDARARTDICQLILQANPESVADNFRLDVRQQVVVGRNGKRLGTRLLDGHISAAGQRNSGKPTDISRLSNDVSRSTDTCQHAPTGQDAKRYHDRT